MTPNFLSVPDLGLIILCGWIFYQDLRDRAVSVFLFGGCLLLAGFKYGISETGYMPLLFNSLFILTQVLAISLYCRFRFGSAKIFRFVGAGDLLFWAVSALLFSPLNFILFFISSLLASFVMFEMLKKYSKPMKLQTVPLAGFQSLVLMMALAFNQFSPAWQPYDDFSLLMFIGFV